MHWDPIHLAVASRRRVVQVTSFYFKHVNDLQLGEASLDLFVYMVQHTSKAQVNEHCAVVPYEQKDFLGFHES